MDGNLLSSLLRKHGLSGADLVRASGYSKGNIYKYYSMSVIKKNMVIKLLKTVNLTWEDWTNHKASETSPAYVINESPELYNSKQNYHQGHNLQVLVEQQMKANAFAIRLKIGRTKLYRLFKEKELPQDVLLKSAEILKVPVATIKGFNEPSPAIGFEKDIYLLLTKMMGEITKVSERVASIERNLQMNSR